MEPWEESQRARAEWLDGLKPGDKVVIPGRWSDPGRIVTVERLTATLVVMKTRERFKRDSGRAAGSADTWHTPHIQPVTDEFRDAIERKGLVDWLDSVSRKRHSMSVEVLRAMKAAHDANAPKEPS
jgi:hypothetical protein